MLNNFFIFRIYLCIAISILLPICYFITIELVNQFLYLMIFIKASYTVQEKKKNVEDINFLVNYLLAKKQWFQCLTMLKFYDNYNDFNSDKLLGMCFHQLSYYNLARYYYIKVLQDENDIYLLEKVIMICKELKDHKMMIQIAERLRKLDPNNTVVLQLNL